MDSCSAFHFQLISQMAEFIKQIDPTVDYQCRLIKDDEKFMKPIFSSALPQSGNSSPGQDLSNNGGVKELDQKQNAESTFYKVDS
jgi:hypothetical protein